MRLNKVFILGWAVPFKSLWDFTPYQPIIFLSYVGFWKVPFYKALTMSSCNISDLRSGMLWGRADEAITHRGPPSVRQCEMDQAWVEHI